MPRKAGRGNSAITNGPTRARRRAGCGSGNPTASSPAWTTAQEFRRVAALGVPTVDVIYSRLPPLQGTARIVTDQRPIAVAAADHLLALGFEQLAFCGYSGIYWSDVRQRRFAEYLAASGRKVIAYQETSARSHAFDTRVELDALLHTANLVRWVREPAAACRPDGLQ